MITNGEYGKMAKKASPPTGIFRNSICAFAVGGGICALGEAFFQIFAYFGIGREDASVYVSALLILLSAALTATGIYDKIAVFAGAGTIVPITGFANSIVSAAMEFKSEGRILGTGANMFKIAGPVIVYGSAAAVIYGIVYYIFLR